MLKGGLCVACGVLGFGSARASALAVEHYTADSSTRLRAEGVLGPFCHGAPSGRRIAGEDMLGHEHEQSPCTLAQLVIGQAPTTLCELGAAAVTRIHS